MKNITEIELSTCFRKSFRRLHSRIQEKAIERTNIFRQNPFDSRLETHPLSGKLEKCWAFSVDKKYRIKFTFLKEEKVLKVLFLDIGTHDIYKK